MTIWRMRIACWTPKAATTHTGYVTLIAFSLQQWLYERAPRVTLYVQCLSCLTFMLGGIATSDVQFVYYCRDTNMASCLYLFCV